MKRACAIALLLAACRSSAPVVVAEHRRVERQEIAGQRLLVEAGLPKPVDFLITPAAAANGSCDLLIHFHGASWIPFQAAGNRPLCIAAVHLGAGSSVYERPLLESGAYRRLIDAIAEQAPPIHRRYLTAFSAGYGAVRAILRNHAETVDGVLLLDGLHTGYTDSGDVEADKMEPFRAYARSAADGKNRFVITHSEIIPGHYASTSETADDIRRAIGIPRESRATKRFGMLPTYEASCGNLLILGFRGDTAPDHMDHFHAMSEFLAMLFMEARVSSPARAPVRTPAPP